MTLSASFWQVRIRHFLLVSVAEISVCRRQASAEADWSNLDDIETHSVVRVGFDQLAEAINCMVNANKLFFCFWAQKHPQHCPSFVHEPQYTSIIMFECGWCEVIASIKLFSSCYTIHIQLKLFGIFGDCSGIEWARRSDSIKAIATRWASWHRRWSHYVSLTWTITQHVNKFEVSQMDALWYTVCAEGCHSNRNEAKE